MPKLGTVATVRPRGDKDPHVDYQAALENRAWALWTAVRKGAATIAGKAARGPANKGLADVDGYEVEVNLTTKMRGLWPELLQMDKQSQNSFLSEVRSFLTVSGNAVCVRMPGIGGGDHGQPLWWIRDEWNDVKGVPVLKTLQPTRTEQRLTPEEAGENRPPETVTVRKQVEANRSVVAALRDRVLTYVRKAPEPVYQHEIVHALQVNTIDVGRALRVLTEEGALHRRIEQRDERPPEINGRYRYVYWPTAQIPKRTTPLTTQSHAMDMVAALKPGEELRISWMPEIDKADIREMVEAGLLDYTQDGNAVKQTDAATKVQESIARGEEPQAVSLTEAMGAEPAPATDFASRLDELIEAEVERRLAGSRLEAGRITDLEVRIQRLEASLIEARAEASEQRALAEKRGRALRELTA